MHLNTLATLHTLLPPFQSSAMFSLLCVREERGWSGGSGSINSECALWVRLSWNCHDMIGIISNRCVRPPPRSVSTWRPVELLLSALCDDLPNPSKWIVSGAHSQEASCPLFFPFLLLYLRQFGKCFFVFTRLILKWSAYFSDISAWVLKFSQSFYSFLPKSCSFCCTKAFSDYFYNKPFLLVLPFAFFPVFHYWHKFSFVILHSSLSFIHSIPPFLSFLSLFDLCFLCTFPCHAAFKLSSLHASSRPLWKLGLPAHYLPLSMSLCMCVCLMK